jgi:hypothetical protein
MTLSPSPTYERARDDLIPGPEDDGLQQLIGSDAREAGSVEVDGYQIAPTAGGNTPSIESQRGRTSRGCRREEGGSKIAGSIGQGAPQLSP